VSWTFHGSCLDRSKILLLFFRTSIWALGPSQFSIGWVRGGSLLGVKWPERDVDPLPPSSAEVQNEWNCTSTPFSISS
jgi:hypothetical protein